MRENDPMTSSHLDALPASRDNVHYLQDAEFTTIADESSILSFHHYNHFTAII